MHTIFNTLINSFVDDKVGIAENFLNAPLALHLKKHLSSLYTNKQLQHAGTGNAEAAIHNKLMRSDIIYWLDRKHNNEYENIFLNLVDDFVLHLNSTCYTGITGYEFHYALYETGSFYKKHIDQFRNSGSRKYSMIAYLNENWKEADGGQLCIHHKDTLQHISPIGGKMVFFESSQMEHEVLIAHKPRMSITGWLKAD